MMFYHSDISFGPKGNVLAQRQGSEDRARQGWLGRAVKLQLGP